MKFTGEQRAAIAMALTRPISVVTGTPGSGKSTCIKGMCDIYNEIGPSVTIPDARDIPNEAPRWMWDLYSSEPRACIMLAAPTGRASQRMTEATGLEAMTIHRLLGFNPALGGFQVGPDCPLPSPSLLIIDESSMMDAELAHQLFSAIPPGVRVVLVGDVDQLPSVGPGAVLQDIIDSQRVPVTRLRYNHRQAGGSVIARNANQLVETKSLPTTTEGDFEARLVITPEAGQAEVMAVVRELHGANEPVTSWQVLAPMHKGPCGTTALNELIRAEVNPPMPGKPEAGPWRLGDKIMVIRNRYDYGVFNGDLGRITDIDLTKACIAIEVGTGAPVTLSLDLAKSLLEHAYAITIHKSQGSEFPTVIVPLLKGHYIMLQRNLLYTAITRARSRLVLIAEPRAVTRAAATQESTRRHTHLAKRIQGPQDTGDVTTQCKTDSPPSGPQ